MLQREHNYIVPARDLQNPLLPPRTSALKYGSEENRFFAAWASGDHVDGAAYEFLKAFHIVYRLLGKIGHVPGAGSRLFPSGEVFVDRLTHLQRRSAGRKAIYYLTIQAIGHTHPDG